MQIKLSPTVLFEDLDGEGILLDMDSEFYYGLDGVGTRFWQLLTDGNDMDSAVVQILTRYAVDEVTLRADLRYLLAELQEAGLVILTDAP